MAKRKAAKAKRTVTTPTSGNPEPVVVALAARLGSILGRGAGRLSKLVPGKKRVAKLAPPKRKGREGEKAKKSAAPRRRKTAAAELHDPLLGAPMGSQVRQKSKRRRAGA